MTDKTEQNQEERRPAQYGVVYDHVFEDDDGFNEETYQEETAAEVAPRLNETLEADQQDDKENEQRSEGQEIGYREQISGIESMEEQREAEEGSMALGWTALVLSLVSLFFLPVLMASAGIVAGFFAYRGGNRTLGLWAIGVGLFSLVMAFFVTPFLTRF